MPTKIEWVRNPDGTQGETWNPIVGCDRVSPGCTNCYAIGAVARGEAMGIAQHVGLTVKVPAEVAVEIRQMYDIEKGTGRPSHRGAWVAKDHPELVEIDRSTSRGPVLTELGRTMARDRRRLDWNGEINVVEHLMDQPLRWRKPRRIFVNSLSDLFHPNVSDDTIARIFAVMALAPQHTFQVLTKRPQRMAEWVSRCDHAEAWITHNGQKPSKGGIVVGDPDRWPLPNVWLGVSVESDRYAWRADHLRRTPAAVRWISAEPLLGPLPSLDLTGIDWLVVGGESKAGARPMHPDWVRDLRDRCTTGRRFCPSEHCGVEREWRVGLRGKARCVACDSSLGEPDGPAFFFKQWGEWAPTELPGGRWAYVVGDRNDLSQMMWHHGKKAAGRELDGRTWDEMPGGAR